MSNPKQIGNSYERECAKKLSKWLTGSDEELVCWRNTHSGSIGTTRIKKGLKGTNVSGDFQCLDSKYQKIFDKFFIDSKSLTKVNLLMINRKNLKSNKLFNEWKKVYDDAWKNKKIPMMLVKIRDNKSIPDFIILPSFYFDDFISLPHINFELSEDLEQFDCKLYLQDEFFQKINWESLVKDY